MMDMAVTGARHEDKTSADAMVDAADGTIAEVKAYLRETRVLAPAAGQVYRRNLEPGEMVAAGLPIVTLVDLSDMWATFHLREDQLAGLTVGSTVQLAIPALGNRDEDFPVSYLAPEADYATWRLDERPGRLRREDLRGARPAGRAGGGPPPRA